MLPDIGRKVGGNTADASNVAWKDPDVEDDHEAHNLSSLRRGKTLFKSATTGRRKEGECCLLTTRSYIPTHSLVYCWRDCHHAHTARTRTAAGAHWTPSFFFMLLGPRVKLRHNVK
jgi:hypothetical protein